LKISKFEEGLPELEFLNELDIQLNQISSIEELEKLVQYENLKNLDIKQNNFIDLNEGSYMFQVIAKIPQLTQVNDFKVKKMIFNIIF